jgi:hypothetical protein
LVKVEALKNLRPRAAVFDKSFSQQINLTSILNAGLEKKIVRPSKI